MIMCFSFSCFFFGQGGCHNSHPPTKRQLLFLFIFFTGLVYYSIMYYCFRRCLFFRKDCRGSNQNSTVTSFERLCILGDPTCANRPDRRMTNSTEVKIAVEHPTSTLPVAPKTISNAKQDVETLILDVTNCGGLESCVPSYVDALQIPALNQQGVIDTGLASNDNRPRRSPARSRAIQHAYLVSKSLPVTPVKHNHSFDSLELAKNRRALREPAVLLSSKYECQRAVSFSSPEDPTRKERLEGYSARWNDVGLEDNSLVEIETVL